MFKAIQALSAVSNVMKGFFPFHTFSMRDRSMLVALHASPAESNFLFNTCRNGAASNNITLVYLRLGRGMPVTFLTRQRYWRWVSPTAELNHSTSHGRYVRLRSSRCFLRSARFLRRSSSAFGAQPFSTASLTAAFSPRSPLDATCV